MKRALCALVVMMAAGVIFSIAFGRASAGHFEHIEAELLAVNICIAVAAVLLLWIKIPEWAHSVRQRLRQLKWLN